MPVDETWLAITKLYAIVSIAAVCLLTLALIYLGVKVWGLVRAAKLMPKVVSDHSKHTVDLARKRGESLVSRGRKLGETCRAGFERIAGKLRAARDLIEQ